VALTQDLGREPAWRGVVVSTPGKARPYAVVLQRSSVVVRSEPVDSLAEGRRVLKRLLADAALE
jgi:hypothetical protein